MYFKALSMFQPNQPVSDLQHIKSMMERSSRFISLSGLSGISAGICALIGSYIAYPYVFGYKDFVIGSGSAAYRPGSFQNDYTIILNTTLFWIAAGTFFMAVSSALFFTWVKSKKQGIPMWGSAARRLMINVSIPLFVGAIYLFRMIHFGTFGLVAPGCLIFYGLALINAGKYTLGEIRYLGYLEVMLGIINLWFVGYGLYFWAFGFGVLHIVYGAYMWYKYERNGVEKI